MNEAKKVGRRAKAPADKAKTVTVSLSAPVAEYLEQFASGDRSQAVERALINFYHIGLPTQPVEFYCHQRQGVLVTDIPLADALAALQTTQI